jgi:hypothetical protein
MTADDVRRYALSLPGAIEQPHFDMASFRVGGKIFATLPPADDVVHLFLTESDRDIALDLHRAFVEVLTWGQRVAGVRVRLGRADARAVRDLIDCAWAGKASKTLRATRNPGQ